MGIFENQRSDETPMEIEKREELRRQQEDHQKTVNEVADATEKAFDDESFRTAEITPPGHPDSFSSKIGELSQPGGAETLAPEGNLTTESYTQELAGEIGESAGDRLTRILTSHEDVTDPADIMASAIEQSKKPQSE